MYTRPTSPRPIGSVIDDAIKLYRASFTRCLPLALIGALILGAIGLYADRRFGLLGGGGTGVAGMMAAMARLRALGRTPGSFMPQLATNLATTIVWLVVRAALIARQEAVAAGRTDSLGGSLAFALRRLPSMVGATIVWVLALAIGMVLLIVPAIWLWGQLQLWLVAMCVEDIGPLKALGRSWRLVERHWWRTSTTVGVAIIIIVVLSLCQGVVAAVAVAVFRADVTTALIVTMLLGVVVSVFTTPMLTVAMLAIYHDLKLRREGGDLAARVSALQPA